MALNDRNIPLMFQHKTKIRVRYGETDQMGYMYYGNYAEFFEVGRVEMLRSLGLTYAGMEASGIMMPVLELNCKYLKPARYDEEITIVNVSWPKCRA
jgi:acyl-CoA thioester hydrolase